MAIVFFLFGIVVAVGLIGYLLTWLSVFSWKIDYLAYGLIFLNCIVIAYAIWNIQLMLFSRA
ncbi:MAG: hypothetical protein Q8T08_11005, partial [Ignavibacteria bacterium]|nr:hypothetical protein [Ignavibacteria bacterium]